MNKKTLTNKLNDIIADKLGVDLFEINPDSHLCDDLGADELDCVELFMEFEHEFNIAISDDISCDWTKVSDIYNFFINEFNVNDFDLSTLLLNSIGDTFYSISHGEVTLDTIIGGSLYLTSTKYSQTKMVINSEGKLSDDGECVLFPSKNNKDWSLFVKKNIEPIVINTSILNRVDVIDHTGRAYNNHSLRNKVNLLIQDDGKTLKVLISNN